MTPMGGIPDDVPRWFVVTAFRYWKSLQSPEGVPVDFQGASVGYMEVFETREEAEEAAGTEYAVWPILAKGSVDQEQP